MSGERRDATRLHCPPLRTMTTRATSGELRRPGCEFATGPLGRRRHPAQPCDVSRDRVDRLDSRQMIVVRKMLHAKVGARAATKSLELTPDDFGRLPTDRRHAAIGHTAAILAVTGCAVAIQLGTRLEHIARCESRREHMRSQKHNPREDRFHGRIVTHAPCRRCAQACVMYLFNAHGADPNMRGVRRIGAGNRPLGGQQSCPHKPQPCHTTTRSSGNSH